MHCSSSVGPLAHSSPLRFRGSAHFCCADSLLVSLAFAFAFASARILILPALKLFCSYDGSFPSPTLKYNQKPKTSERSRVLPKGKVPANGTGSFETPPVQISDQRSIEVNVVLLLLFFFSLFFRFLFFWFPASLFLLPFPASFLLFFATAHTTPQA
jgi:hypothetical protein